MNIAPEVVDAVNAAPQPETKWYVLRVVSGKERSVKEYLDKDIARSGWVNIIKQVFYQWKKCTKYRTVKK